MVDEFDPGASDELAQIEARNAELRSLIEKNRGLQSQINSYGMPPVAQDDFLSVGMTPLLEESPLASVPGKVLSGIGTLGAGVKNALGSAVELGEKASLHPLGMFGAAVADPVIESVSQDPVGAIDTVGRTAAETAAGAAAFSIPGVGPWLAPSASAAGGYGYELLRDYAIGRSPQATPKDLFGDMVEYSAVSGSLASVVPALRLAKRGSSIIGKAYRSMFAPEQAAIADALAKRDEGFFLAFGGKKASTDTTKAFLKDLAANADPILVKELSLDDLPTNIPTVRELALMTDAERAALRTMDPIATLRERVAGKLDKAGADKANAISYLDAALDGQTFGAEDFDFSRVGQFRRDSRLTPDARETFAQMADQSRATINRLQLAKPNPDAIKSELLAVDNALAELSTSGQGTLMNPGLANRRYSLESRRAYLQDRLANPRPGATAGEVWEEVKLIDERLSVLSAYDVGPGQRAVMNPSENARTAEVAALAELRSILTDGISQKAQNISVGDRPLSMVIESANQRYGALKDFDKLLDETQQETRQQLNKLIQGGRQVANTSEVSGSVGEVKKGIIASIFKDNFKRLGLEQAMDRDVEMVRDAAEILRRKKYGLPVKPPATMVESVLQSTLPFRNDIKELWSDDRSRFAIGWLLYHNGQVDSPLTTLDSDEKSLAEYADQLAVIAPEFFVGKAYASESVSGKLNPKHPQFAEDFAKSKSAIEGVDSVSSRYKRKQKLYVGFKPYGGSESEMPDVNVVTPTPPTTGYMKPEPLDVSKATEEKSAIDTVSDNLED